MATFLIVEDNRELAELISASVQARGHTPQSTLSGKKALELLRTGHFDGAVVDLLLPDMRGSDVLDALAKLKVPSVAISGVYKGARFAKEATELHGAVAFLEKPFDMGSLVTALEKAARVVPPPEAPAAPAKDAFDALGPVVSVPKNEPAWPQKQTRLATPSAPPNGSLKESPVPRLLNAQYEARHQGELRLKQGLVLKVIYFENGSPVYAASNLAQERFARFCARKGLLPESELKTVAELAKGEGVRTGEAMIQLGLLTAEKRKELLEQQVREIIWSTFRWTEGEYSYAPKQANRADLVKLSVFPGDLILQGVGSEFPLVDLRQRAPATRRYFPAPDPPYELHELELSAEQARLMAYADGSKTVDDLVALADLPEREALATIVAFELMGLLEARSDKSRKVSFGL